MENSGTGSDNFSVVAPAVFWKLYLSWQLDSEGVKYAPVDRNLDSVDLNMMAGGCISARGFSSCLSLRCSQHLDHTVLNDRMIDER